MELLLDFGLSFRPNGFWALTLVAIIVLAFTKVAPAKSWAFAAINFVFLLGVLGVLVIPLCALVFGFHLWLTAGKRKVPWLVLGGILVAFLIRKDVFELTSELAPVYRLLVGIGFSYVMLRGYDLWAFVKAGGEEPRVVETLNFLLPFHMIAAGPIQQYKEFREQGREVPATVSFEQSVGALELITHGLFKKFFLAAIISDIFLTDFQVGGWYIWVEAQFFFLWLYLDFSAYSDVAIGIGRLMGVKTPDNFNRPYLARNMIGFWDRWHITLSEFVKKHIFIPIQLGLMRSKYGRFQLLCASIAFTVAFLLCGLWHGVSMPYFLWGAIHALGLVLCNLYKHFLLRKLGRKGVKRYMENPVIRVVATFITYQWVALSLLAMEVEGQGSMP